MICHCLVSFGFVFSLTIDLLGRETQCKRNKLVLSLILIILMTIFNQVLSVVLLCIFHQDFFFGHLPSHFRDHHKSSQKPSETNKISFTRDPSLTLKRTEVRTSGFNSQTNVYTKHNLKPKSAIFPNPPPPAPPNEFCSFHWASVNCCDGPLLHAIVHFKRWLRIFSHNFFQFFCYQVCFMFVYLCSQSLFPNIQQWEADQFVQLLSPGSQLGVEHRSWGGLFCLAFLTFSKFVYLNLTKLH